MAPRRFLKGISSVSSSHPLAPLPYLDPTTWAILFEDFILLPDIGEDWTNTNTNGTPTVSDAGGAGAMVLTLGGADNDLAHLYPATGTFTLASGKKALFEAKFKIDKGAGGTIGQEEVFVGLAGVQTGADFTAADGSAMAVNDCVGFWSTATTAGLNAIVRDTDVESTTPVETYVDATYYTVGWYFDGSSVKFYVNDSMIATLNDYPADTALTPTLFVKAGAAHAKVLTCDYILVARER